eukprot:gnl/MRDRNA2_/MRDRNA2_54131_c0_seq1.p1 gnl/MRDRNA2_/MRDRNA2_54131_c0~~gnl/MRDRNA2_/MRDRNA2_54131_c0_seq1.p1  ORF type:complete len:284 (+),score=85.58 gnl/MRDRNA2_/MRDRNA2_54131_c0_seq1:74-925(+)
MAQWDGVAPDFDQASDEDVLNWKREHNIRTREAEWKKRQDEMLMQKQVSWEVLRLEKENRLAAAREAARRKHCEERLRVKQEEVEREYRERCREVAIDKRTQHWLTTNNEKNCAYVNSWKEKLQQDDQQRLSNKEHRAQELLEATTKKAEQTQQDAELEGCREDNINKRDIERQSREADRTRKLKADAVALKEANSARFAKGKGGLIRSVLKTSNRPERTKEQAAIEAVRQENLERMRTTRDGKEAKHILQCKAKLKEENSRFKGSTEQDIILARVPIFGTMT